jgi:hypothetical protein|tara:strand:+ start:21900 stop:22403 length:504 start_codon:yes stop_codon:yes gene_type:complete
MNHIEPFWDDEYKHLEYKKMPFNNEYDVVKWREGGYHQDEKYFTGQMVGHKGNLPTWNQTFLDLAKYQYNLKDVGVCYYRMVTNEIIPLHRDNYKLYREKFNCEMEDITRIVVFLEDWKSGHYFEIDGHPIVNWKAGNSVTWVGNIEHMAANIGIDYRYTLQITGHR